MSTPRPRAGAAVVALLLFALAAAPARAADTLPGRVVVKFAAGQRTAAIDRAGVGVDSVQPLSHVPGTAVLDLAPGQSVAGAIRDLEAARGVVWAEQEGVVRPFATPNDPLFGQQWGLENTGQTVLDPSHSGSLPPDHGSGDEDIDAAGAWDLTTGSRAVAVGIVDNGVDASHPDLAANVDASRGGNTFNGGGNGPDAPANDSFHGTHVAGIVGAVGNNGIGVAGVNWQVTMLPFAALGYDPALCGGSSSCGTTASVANGLAAAGASGARVANASIGGTPGGLSSGQIQVETDAVAAHDTTLYVFAAGNDGNNNDASGQGVYPCNIPTGNVICVARSQIDDSLASTSNYGATSVDLAAPGGRILSTMPGSAYEKENGTSMASPMVAGVAALILARNPWSSVAQVKDAILSSVDHRPAFAGKTVTGGRLNARAALVASDDTVNPAAFSLTGPSDGTLTNGRSTVTWSASSDDKSGIDHYAVLVDGSPAVTAQGQSADLDVPEGTHAIAVRAFDRAGNTTTTGSTTVTADRTAPSNPGGGSPLNGALLNTARPAIAWAAASDGGSGLVGYDVSVDGGPATRLDAAATSFTPPAALGQGTHTWSVKAIDRAGNVSAGLTGAFLVDTVAPSAPGGEAPVSGRASRDRTPRLSWDGVTDAGSGLAYYEVQIDDDPAQRVSATSFVPAAALGNGRHEWTVRAVDRAGNMSSRGGGEFRVDTSAPKASASAASSGSGTLRVKCRSSEAGRCAVTVVASTSVAKRLGLARRTLGTKSATLNPPGRTLTVRLTAKARRALRRAGRTRVTVRVTVTDAAGNATHKSTGTTAR